MSLKETISKALAPSLKKIGVDIKDLYKKIEDVPKNVFNHLTEEQRQSLKGPKGDVGPQGPPGPQGPAGGASAPSKLTLNKSTGVLTIGEQGDSTVTLPSIRTFQWLSPNGTSWFKSGSGIKLVRKGQFVFAYFNGPRWGTVDLFSAKSSEASRFIRDSKNIDGKEVSWYRFRLPNGNGGFQGHPIIPYGFRPVTDVTGVVYGDSGLIVASILFGSGSSEHSARLQYEGTNDTALSSHKVEMLRLAPIVWITTDDEPQQKSSPTEGDITII